MSFFAFGHLTEHEREFCAVPKLEMSLNQLSSHKNESHRLHGLRGTHTSRDCSLKDGEAEKPATDSVLFGGGGGRESLCVDELPVGRLRQDRLYSPEPSLS